MAAPAWVAASGLNVITGTTASLFTSDVTPTPGNVIIVHALQDGTGTDVTIDFSNPRVENLAGTDNAITSIGAFNVGGTPLAKQHLWIGRFIGSLGESTTTRLTSSSGNDVYAWVHEFSGVHTGTTLADVLENGSAGTTVNGTGDTDTVLDTGVTTLGADRLACNFIGVNDDNQASLTAMTGETGGDWVYPTAAVGSSTGTDGCVGLVTATIASAGTINGGSDVMAAADAWGVVGFALIPAAAAAPASLLLPNRNQLVIRR